MSLQNFQSKRIVHPVHTVSTSVVGRTHLSEQWSEKPENSVSALAVLRLQYGTMPPAPPFILALSSHRRENAPKFEQDFVALTLLVIRPLVRGQRARRHTARGFVV